MLEVGLGVWELSDLAGIRWIARLCLGGLGFHCVDFKAWPGVGLAPYCVDLAWLGLAFIVLTATLSLA